MSSHKMTKERYFMMCDQLGMEPKEKEIPIDASDFPYAVQVAITIFSFLSDRWEGMSGTYLGKDYSLIPYLFKLYEVDNELQVFHLISRINSIVLEIRAEEQKRRQSKNKAKKGTK